jgi:hypothetical protein
MIGARSVRHAFWRVVLNLAMLGARLWLHAERKAA